MVTVALFANFEAKRPGKGSENETKVQYNNQTIECTVHYSVQCTCCVADRTHNSTTFTDDSESMHRIYIN
jgi:hypothetical protein